MNTYPTEIRQSIDSIETRLGGRVLDRATNGSTRARSLFSAEKKAFKVVHQFKTLAQKTSIEAFYITNQNVSFLFLWVADGQTYTCIFDATDPIFTLTHGGFWNIEVYLAQV